MPYLDLITNVKIDDVKSFIQELSKFSAETLGAPEQYVSINYTHSEGLSFAGTLDPAFQLRVIAWRYVDEEHNNKNSAAFSKFLQEKLGTPVDRGYIVFENPGTENIGFKGTTFSTILKTTGI